MATRGVVAFFKKFLVEEATNDELFELSETIRLTIRIRHSNRKFKNVKVGYPELNKDLCGDNCEFCKFEIEKREAE